MYLWMRWQSWHVNTVLRQFSQQKKRGKSWNENPSISCGLVWWKSHWNIKPTHPPCVEGGAQKWGPPQHGWDFPIILVSLGQPGKLWICSHFCFQCLGFFLFGCFKIQKHTRSSSPLVWDSPEDENRASRHPLIMKPQRIEGHCRDWNSQLVGDCGTGRARPPWLKPGDCCPPGNLSRAASLSTVRKGHLFRVWGCEVWKTKLLETQKYTLKWRLFLEMKTVGVCTVSSFRAKMGIGFFFIVTSAWFGRGRAL